MMIEEILPDAEHLAARAADWFVDTLNAGAAASQGKLLVALSGGSTPKRLYQLLAAPGLKARVPWNRVHWCWGDERFVPPDDDESNFRMVRKAMLDPAMVTEDHVHPIPTLGFSPEAAAVFYQAELARLYGAVALDPARPLFHITLLGLGTNGHTASLFPDMPVLQEQTSWAASVTPPGEHTRITLTYPAIESSRHAAFLIAGADKQPMAARLRRGDETIPAGRVHPTGELRAFLDQAAAG